MRWAALLLLIGCGESGVSGGDYTGWAGFMDTPDGSYGAFLFLGDLPDAGWYQAHSPGLSGPIAGLPPHLTFHPSGCDAGFDGMAAVSGDAMVFSYSGAACAKEPTGSGTLYRWYDRIP